MKMRWAWTLPVLSILAWMAPEATWAQGPMGYPGGMGMPMTPQVQGYMPMMGAGYPAMPAGYMGPGGPPGLLPDAYGAYGSAPDGMPMGGGGGMPMGPAQIYGDNCGHCGGMGCGHCGGMGGRFGHGGHGHGQGGLLGDVFGLVAPYPDGGCAAVRWYDFAVDYMALRREDAGRRVDFASSGVNGPIVLDSTDLDFDAESSFRFSAMFQWGAGSNIEFTYFGLFFWDDAASVTDPTNSLFSPFSEFGLNPPPPGFAETDEADFVAIDYESSFDSFEVNFRQRWMAPNCRYQGSCILGVRYFKLDEDFNYFTQSTAHTIPGDPLADPPIPDVIPGLAYNVNVHNNMVGAQIGGDIWMCILPGLRVGAEGKAAVLANRAAVESTIATNVPDAAGVVPAPEIEDLVENDVAFLGEANLFVTYRLNYQWTLRGGYQFLYVDGVALGPENFNAAPPLLLDPASTRVAAINDNGAVFYHGWFAGTEFMW
ncbi:MAG: BBP7 family outer membrane beta-barrel protein [Planctomycetaceae bacterium]|nr:BBP7 family outer membrane beta-barrel protein [Planctomycetaceae bacterium]